MSAPSATCNKDDIENWPVIVDCSNTEMAKYLAAGYEYVPEYGVLVAPDSEEDEEKYPVEEKAIIIKDAPSPTEVEALLKADKKENKVKNFEQTSFPGFGGDHGYSEDELYGKKGGHTSGSAGWYQNKGGVWEYTGAKQYQPTYQTYKPCPHAKVFKLFPSRKGFKGNIYVGGGSNLRSWSGTGKSGFDPDEYDLTMIVALSGSMFECFEDIYHIPVMAYPMRDYGTWPLEVLRFRAEWIIQQYKEGQNILFGCTGGHGRTGLVAAAIAILLGYKRALEDPVTWIRHVYCHKAIESDCQITTIDRFNTVIHKERGMPEPKYTGKTKGSKVK